MSRAITITLPTLKTRKGVPAHLAARFVERTVRNKKGKGSFKRRPRNAHA